MWCPRCGGEFQPGFDRCSECDVALVDSDPMQESSADTLATARVQVFEFAERTIRDGEMHLLGSCRYRRRVYDIADVAGAPVWSWSQTGSFFDGGVFDAAGVPIGQISRKRLEAGGQPFGALELSGRRAEVRNPAGLVIARVARTEGFFTSHARVEVTMLRRLAAHQQFVVAALACSYEASATFSE